MNGEPKLIIEAIQVGHGDCTLISWNNGRMKKDWNCLIDAGDGDFNNNVTIAEALDKHGITTIDLAILSHFDTDHIGGFNALCDKKNIKIITYWSPYTPAFRKYLWLFGNRGQQAIERANQLEEKLHRLNVDMQSPLDGYVTTPVEELRMSVFSPPSKLYERLLSGQNIAELFELYPTPVGTIFLDSFDYSAEGLNNALVRGFQRRKIDNRIQRDLQSEQKELTDAQVHTNNISIDKELVCKKQGIGPEFFGNHLLNDTSLVIKMEFWLGSQWFSALFPGDLENWVYVMKLYQPLLYSNYFKVSHHGGSVFIGQDNGVDQVFQAIRPSIATISASGRYGLPHSDTREALVRWSSSVFCSLQKGCEHFRLDGNLPINNKCCKDTFNCQKVDRGTSVLINSHNIRVNKQACQRTYTPNSLPVIQFEQHFIPDSNILVNLSEREIDRHTGYVKKHLNDIHNERVKEKNIGESKLVSLEEVHSKLLHDKRHLTQRQIEQIFRHGYLKREFWSNVSEDYRGSSWREAYKQPSEPEVNKMWALIEKSDLIISPIRQFVRGVSSMINEVSRENFATLCERQTAYPGLLIEKYVWPKLIPNIIKGFNIAYITTHGDRQKFVFFYKRASSLKSILERELRDAPEVSYMDYRRTDYYINRYNKYASGSEKVMLLSSLVTTTRGNKVTFIDELFTAFTSLSGYFGYPQYELITLSDDSN